MTVLSIDLAYKRCADLGIVALSQTEDGLFCDFVSPPDFSDCPEPERVAMWALEVAHRQGANYIMLDGPQAWKDPDNGFLHSRVCERELNAPAKTGLPYSTKPANYLPFISFSIAVFSALENAGWPRLCKFTQVEVQSHTRAAIESLPLAAWRTLGLPALPAKKKAKPGDLVDRLDRLRNIYSLELSMHSPSHDQLQALVSGLGAANYAFGARRRTKVAGLAPRYVEGIPREGYILNPSRDPLPT